MFAAAIAESLIGLFLLALVIWGGRSLRAVKDWDAYEREHNSFYN